MARDDTGGAEETDGSSRWGRSQRGVGGVVQRRGKVVLRDGQLPIFNAARGTDPRLLRIRVV